MIPVSRDKIVSFWFRLHAADGTLLEDVTSGEPIRYLDDGNQFDGRLQAEMDGMREGQSHRFLLSEEMMPGQSSCWCTIYMGRVREASDAEILLGYPVEIGEVCDERCACHEKN